MRKKIGTDPSCRFREKRKNRLTTTHSNSKKWPFDSNCFWKCETDF